MAEEQFGYHRMETPVGTDKENPQQPQYPRQGQNPPQYTQHAVQGQNPLQYTQEPTQTIVVRQTQLQPNDYMALAIIVTICCCLPLGIVGIVKSSEVRNRYLAGDYAGAEEASREAKNWSIAGLVTGSVLIGGSVLIYVIWWIVAVSAVAASSPHYSYSYK